MTILDLVRILRSNLKLLLVSMIAGILLAAGYTMTRPVQYTAGATAQLVAGNSQDANSAIMSQQLASGRAPYYAQLASGGAVAQRIVKASNGALTGGDFSITGSAAGAGAATLGLTAVASTPEKAQKAANLATAALAAEAHRVETLGSGDNSTVYRVFPLSQAGLPSAPSSPNWKFNLAVGGLLGLLAGIGIVVLRKQLDSRIRHTSDLEKATGAGVLGVIPREKDLQSQERGGLGHLGATSEAFRMLRTNLRYVSADQAPRSIVITSAVQGEGKSTVSANLARVLAAAGQKVVLVDTDLRRPVVHETFEADNSVGLTELLTGQVDLKDVIQQGDHKNLSLITAGRIPPNPSELLGSRRMSAIVEALSEEYFVVLDAPPLLPVTDAGLLSVAADGVAVVYHYGRTHREQVALCTKILSQVGGHYMGSILNMTPPKQMGSAIYGYGAGSYGATGYGYGYGYGYGAVDDSDIASAPTPAPIQGLSLPTKHTEDNGVAPLSMTPSVTSEESHGATAIATTPSQPRPESTVADGSTEVENSGKLPSRRSLRSHQGE